MWLLLSDTTSTVNWVLFRYGIKELQCVRITTLLFLSIYSRCVHTPHFLWPLDILPCVFIGTCSIIKTARFSKCFGLLVAFHSTIEHFSAILVQLLLKCYWFNLQGVIIIHQCLLRMEVHLIITVVSCKCVKQCHMCIS